MKRVTSSRLTYAERCTDGGRLASTRSTRWIQVGGSRVARVARRVPPHRTSRWGGPVPARSFRLLRPRRSIQQQPVHAHVGSVPSRKELSVVASEDVRDRSGYRRGPGDPRVAVKNDALNVHSMAHHEVPHLGGLARREQCSLDELLGGQFRIGEGESKDAQALSICWQPREVPRPARDRDDDMGHLVGSSGLQCLAAVDEELHRQTGLYRQRISRCQTQSPSTPRRDGFTRHPVRIDKMNRPPMNHTDTLVP